MSADIMSTLIWNEDSHIINHFGEHVWLGPSYNIFGVKIGITDCCKYDDPCEWHLKLSKNSIKPIGGNNVRQ